MTEGSGTSLANLVDDGPTGALMNSPTWVEGPGGDGTYGVNFDGSNQWANLGTNARLNAIGGLDGGVPVGFTLSAWVKTSTAGVWYRSDRHEVSSTRISSALDGDRRQPAWICHPRHGGARERPRWRADKRWTTSGITWSGVRGGERTHLPRISTARWWAPRRTPPPSVSNTANIELARHSGGRAMSTEAISGVGVWDRPLNSEEIYHFT